MWSRARFAVLCRGNYGVAMERYPVIRHLNRVKAFGRRRYVTTKRVEWRWFAKPQGSTYESCDEASAIGYCHLNLPAENENGQSEMLAIKERSPQRAKITVSAPVLCHIGTSRNLLRQSGSEGVIKHKICFSGVPWLKCVSRESTLRFSREAERH